MTELPKARSKNLVVQEAGDELLIYDLISNKALCLNNTCRLVWNYCDGQTPIDQIGLKVSPRSTAEYREQLVLVALSRLEEKGLLEAGSGKFDRNQTSRREMMRILGVAGGMSLPLIMSIAAPEAVNALSAFSCSPASGCGPFSSCCNGTHCCSTGQPCCDTGCCPPGQACCSNSFCFNPLNGNSCCGFVLCNSVLGETCCNNTHCCNGGQTCCGSSCCNIGQSCCGSSCCDPGEVCLNGTCRAPFPV